MQIFFVQMVRNYQRKRGSRTYACYSEEMLQEALLEVMEGRLSQKAVSRKNKIRQSTILNYFFIFQHWMKCIDCKEWYHTACAVNEAICGAC